MSVTIVRGLIQQAQSKLAEAAGYLEDGHLADAEAAVSSALLFVRRAVTEEQRQ